MEQPHFPEDLLDKPMDRHEFLFEDWKFNVTRHHILSSKCERTNREECPEGSQQCKFCEWTRTLTLPHWPDMNFADNTLTLTHASNATVSFDAVNALKGVNDSEADESVKVASSEMWMSSRKDKEETGRTLKPYDWTYTTKYRGDYTGFQIWETEERINLEELKKPEEILFYQELPLFEDELADHGCSTLLLKFRSMPSGFFGLLRFYLRVDHVLVRIFDTRLHWKKGNNFLLREFVCREERMEAMKDEEKKDICDPNALWSQLPVTHEEYHKLTLPTP